MNRVVGERGKEQGEGAYDWRRWHELLRRRALNLEPTNLEKRERPRPDAIQPKL